MPHSVTLFVGNLSYVANAQYLERLFSSYGEVQQVTINNKGHNRFAEVTFSSIDDGDAAIAALHYRYQTAKSLPLVVLYSKKSKYVSDYGRLVGREYRQAMEDNRLPRLIMLDQFDPHFERSEVQPPPSEEFIPESRPSQGI
ncbi:unnamed protein product [Phytomonas sp. Hart1]|nr:unnamed protein product [Phytomonas sp. Hart1]|eukprot:CCW68164.1 unnamed protein product [Phytomonas sp. isolate Hart1]